MFEIRHRDGAARAGILHTRHGKLETPFFMPVATKGAIKHLDYQELDSIGSRCIISNALLLYLKPGLKTISRAGGLHRFCGWSHGIFTDSGGFQSLDGFFMKGASHDAASFRSPFDGTTHKVTPELAMDMQIALGSDVAMCLDDVPRPDDSPQAVRTKTLHTHSWARRCISRHRNAGGQLLFGICQGGLDRALRKKSAGFIAGLGFAGHAVGGLAIGEPRDVTLDLIRASVSMLPDDRPRYVMGVGSPEDVLDCIALGIDCFDSTYPTQNARHATLLTWQGRLRIKRKEYSDDLRPVDSSCGCIACRHYTRAYIHHLLKVDEPLGKKLATAHNLFFMQEFISAARKAISDRSLGSFRQGFIESQSSTKQQQKTGSMR